MLLPKLVCTVLGCLNACQGGLFSSLLYKSCMPRFPEGCRIPLIFRLFPHKECGCNACRQNYAKHQTSHRLRTLAQRRQPTSRFNTTAWTRRVREYKFPPSLTSDCARRIDGLNVRIHSTNSYRTEKEKKRLMSHPGAIPMDQKDQPFR